MLVIFDNVAQHRKFGLIKHVLKSNQMSTEYWQEARDNGIRQVAYASKMLGHEMTDRHRMYEEDFNALVQIEVNAGRVEEAVGSLAVANFHVFMVHTRFPAQASPRFYE